MSLHDVLGFPADDGGDTTPTIPRMTRSERRAADRPAAARRPLPPPNPAPRHAAPAAKPGRHLSQGPRRRARPPRRRVRVSRVLLTALSFTLLLGASAAVVGTVAYRKYNGQITRVAVLATKDPNIREATRQQNAENFLVLGSDTRAGADAQYGNVAGARSDTTMLVHLSPDRSKATVVSIPRDAWVDIPTCVSGDGSSVAAHQDMFNSAFTVGGPKCTIATVQKLTGIAVTHFVEIDFSGFQSMVNAMGQVTICSPQSVFDSGSGLRLHQGNNQLDGQQALAYVRARESLGDGSDIGRIKRQQLFLGAVMRQAESGKMLGNPARLTSFLDAATKAITVDTGTTFNDLRTLTSSLQGLDPRRVVFYTAPIANANYTPPGTSMTGRVLLDDVKGRVLYDAVIHDAKPVLVPASGSKSAPTSQPAAAATGSAAATIPAAPATSAPTGTSAAEQSCSL
jgi:LCP family protein required for cell wall assembly